MKKRLSLALTSMLVMPALAGTITAIPSQAADDYHPLYSVSISDVTYWVGHEGVGSIEYSSDGAVFAWNNKNNGGTTVIEYPTKAVKVGAVSVRYRTDTKFQILPWNGGWTNGGVFTKDDGLWHDMVINLPGQSLPSFGGGSLIQLIPAGAGNDIGKKIQIKAINYYSSVKNAELDNQINPPVNETVSPELAVEIDSASVSVSDDYALNFKVRKAVLDGAADYSFTLERGEDKVKFSKKGIPFSSENSSFYTFSYTDIAPNMMNDTVTATLKVTDSDGKTVEKTKAYSVADYCFAMLATKPTNALSDTIKAMLNYGAYAQKLTDYNTSAIDARYDGILSDPDKGDYQNKCNTSGDTSLLTVTNAKLILDNGVNIELTVKRADGDTSEHTVTDREGKVTALVFDGNGVARYTQKVSFLLLNKEYEFVFDVGKLVFTYGVETYGARMYDFLNGKEKKLFDSLMIFGNTVDAYTEVALPQGAVIDKYDLDTAMKSIWEGDIAYNESVMFVGKTTVQPLMYTPDRIISLRSPDLKTEYVEGVDYTVTDDGKLLLTDNTSIPYMTEDQYYPKEAIPNGTFGSNLGSKRPYVMFGENDTMIKWQVFVTYKHSDSWKGYKAEDKSRMLPKFNEKLASGEPCTVLWYGDSITVGGNASGMVGVEPFQPIWARMTTDFFASVSGNSKIKYVNTAVGGTGIEWGIDNVKTSVIDYQPDLVVIGFGMNDGPMTADAQTKKTIELINKIKAECPNTEFVVIATMLPNREANGFWANQIYYEAEYLKQIENGMGIPVVRMGTVHDELVKAKMFYHMTGNNINHAGDFLVRAYAQSIAMTVIGK